METGSQCGEKSQSGSNTVSTDRDRTLQPPRIWREVPIDDTPDYNTVITWGDSDDEAGDCPTNTNLAAVSKKTESLVKKACTKRLINSACLQTRNVSPLPQVAATRTPQLDSFIKPEVPQLVKTSDKEWARLQTFVLNALAPLTLLLEIDAKGETISHDQALEAAKAATQLIGNASAQISHVQRSKVLTHLNKSLLPLQEEDTNSEDVAPLYLGRSLPASQRTWWTK